MYSLLLSLVLHVCSIYLYFFHAPKYEIKQTFQTFNNNKIITNELWMPMTLFLIF